MCQTYINIDFELLYAELQFCGYIADCRNNWKRYKPTIKDIDNLYKHYKCLEFMENFYDSEPDYDDEEFKMYMDYIVKYKTDDDVTSAGLFNALLYMNDKEKLKTKRFSEKKHSDAELKEAYKHIIKLQKEYNPRRIAFNNWQEPHFAGNWGVTQEQVDILAKKTLKAVKQAKVENRDRLWIIDIPFKELPKNFWSWSEKITSDLRIIVYYGRDYLGVDYVWIMEKINENSTGEKVCI